MDVCTYTLMCVYISHHGGCLTLDGELDLAMHVCLHRHIYSRARLCACVHTSLTRGVD